MKKTNAFGLKYEIYSKKKKTNWVEVLNTIFVLLTLVAIVYSTYLVIDTLYVIIKYYATN